MMEEIQSLKEHITEKFKNHEEIEALRHKRINELLDHYNKEIEGNEGTIRRVHSRVDKIETKNKNGTGYRYSHRYSFRVSCGLVWNN